MAHDRRRAMPWLAAAVAAVAAAAAILAYVLVDPADDDSSAKAGFTADERAAVTAAGIETANILTFRRAHYEADFQRALSGATGALKTDIQGKKKTTLAAMTQGKFDLYVEVQHLGLVGPATDMVGNSKLKGYTVLVSLNGYRSSQKTLPTPANLSVTVVKQGGKWLASALSGVGVSS